MKKSCKKIKEKFDNKSIYFEDIFKIDALELIKKLPGNHLLLQMSFQFKNSKNLLISLIFSITVPPK